MVRHTIFLSMGKLSSVTPSADELAEARRILKAGEVDKARKKEIRNGFAHFLRSQCSEDEQARLKGIRGQERDAEVEKYLVWQLQAK